MQMTPMARSAIPLSSWTYAGANERVVADLSHISKKRLEMSSPPLSECTRWMVTAGRLDERPRLAMVLKSAKSRSVHSGASSFFFIG